MSVQKTCSNCPPLKFSARIDRQCLWSELSSRQVVCETSLVSKARSSLNAKTSGSERCARSARRILKIGRSSSSCCQSSSDFHVKGFSAPVAKPASRPCHTRARHGMDPTLNQLMEQSTDLIASGKHASVCSNHSCTCPTYPLSWDVTCLVMQPVESRTGTLQGMASLWRATHEWKVDRTSTAHCLTSRSCIHGITAEPHRSQRAPFLEWSCKTHLRPMVLGRT